MTKHTEISKTDVRDALIFCLWHMQGGHSEVGQTIRQWLGIGQFDQLTIDQYNTARAIQSCFDLMDGVKAGGSIREWCKCEVARFDSDKICMYCDMPRKDSK